MKFSSPGWPLAAIGLLVLGGVLWAVWPLLYPPPPDHEVQTVVASTAAGGPGSATTSPSPSVDVSVGFTSAELELKRLGGQVMVPVIVSGPHDTAITVHYTVATVDGASIDAGTVSFAASETSKLIGVPTANRERTHVTLRLADAEGAVLGLARTTVTIS